MISFNDLMAALRQRLRLVIATAAIIFLAIMALALILPRQYTAYSSVLVDLTESESTANASANNMSVIDSIIGTQVDIIRSTAVLEEVARRLPKPAATDAAGPDETRIQNMVAQLRKQLIIATDKGSNVVRLSYTSVDPRQSAATLNLIVDVFLQKQVELLTNPARINARWYDQRTREVRERFEAAQTRLSNFQREHGILDIDRMGLEADKVRNLSTQLVQAQADAAAAHSRAGSAAMPEVAGSTIVQDLQREVGLQDGRVSELAKTLGPNHPTLVAANAHLGALRSALGQARGTQANALSAASSAAGRREADLRATLVQQQQRLLSLSGVQDQLNVLQRDVDAARQTYDTVRQRFNDSELKSEISQASASRLDRASPPVLPSKPNLILWFLAAMILGAGGGLAVGVARELTRPRVRTAEGATQAFALDVIADFTAPMPRRLSWRGPHGEEGMA